MKALGPLSWLYGAGVAMERRRLVPKLGDGTAPRVVSIGNLEAGGNGKTPLAMWWLARSLASGRRPAYVSRGYGGAVAPAGVVTCVVPEDLVPAQPRGLRMLSRSHPDLVTIVGDEGALVAERVPGAVALFSRDKRRAVSVAAGMGADVVVLDDAFQSWRVARHVDVVMLDAEAPLDAGRLLPAGRLRETPDALRRADVVVFNGATPEALGAARARVAPWLRRDTLVAGMDRRVILASADGSQGTAPARLAVVSAIARPAAFERSLSAAGIEIAAHVVRRDHHRYDAADAREISAVAAREKVDVVTTEKDWVKLRHAGISTRVWIARLEITLHGDALPVET